MNAKYPLAALLVMMIASAYNASPAQETEGWTKSVCGSGSVPAGIECQVEAHALAPVNGRDRGLVKLSMPDGKWIAEDCELGIDWVGSEQVVSLRMFWRENPGDGREDWKMLCRRWFSTHDHAGGIAPQSVAVPIHEQGMAWRWDIPDRRIQGGDLFVQFGIVGDPGVARVFGTLYGQRMGK